MGFPYSIVLSSVIALAAASLDPQITPRAQLDARQNADPAFLGWPVGASQTFSPRSCDFPATLSRSGSLAQCCAPNAPCVFWTACTGNLLLAAQTSLACDQGYCNTAVLVQSAGASNGQEYLGCWPTSYGSARFSVVAVTPAGSSGTPGSTAATRVSSSVVGGTSAAASASAAQSSGAASDVGRKPWTGVIGVVAVLFGMV
ncbi:hypothetical protein CC86DRAFT_470961 [Ophiobolus disseminans]|uniref:Extracellular membrane protein CFEM domain-containing protein n=1 Tax=Ophiobolus disseminans TaxID=1469910 RepID=A0A6A6ZLW7_9PLEO|nr:hypothetical protein CC86DRAFT_470961 [Ophiobolus disseminans]